MPHRSKKEPWYPNKELSFGSLYFFIRQKTHNFNAFDDASILEAKQLILKEARAASPSYKLFITAAKAATGLSERTIKSLLYNNNNKES